MVKIDGIETTRSKVVEVPQGPKVTFIQNTNALRSIDFTAQNKYEVQQAHTSQEHSHLKGEKKKKGKSMHQSEKWIPPHIPSFKVYKAEIVQSDNNKQSMQ